MNDLLEILPIFSKVGMSQWIYNTMSMPQPLYATVHNNLTLSGPCY